MFTPDELVEARKIVQARQDMWQLIKDLAYCSDAPTDGVLTRAEFASIWDDLRAASFTAGRAFQWLAGVIGSVPPKLAEEFKPLRADQVAAAQATLGDCRTNLMEASAAAANYPGVERFNSVSSRAANIASDLDSFDWSLTFDDPNPPHYPAIVGPHGHFVMAQMTLARADSYFDQTVSDTIVLFREILNWDASINGSLRGFIKNVGGFQAKLLRAQGMDLGVLIPSDAAIVASDGADSSGLRPDSFFQLLLANEIIYNSGSPAIGQSHAELWNGRSLKEGAAGELQAMMQSLVNIIKGLHSYNPVEEFTRRLGTVHGASCDAFTGLGDLRDFWRDFDAYSLAITQFFAELPGPPVVGPGAGDLVAGPGTFIDSSTTPPTVRPQLGPDTEIDSGTGNIVCTLDPQEPISLDYEISIQGPNSTDVYEARQKP